MAAKAEKPKAEKKVNPALQKPLQPSKELAAIVGSAPLPRGQVVSKVWDYIKKENLQNPKNKREIMADAKLEPIRHYYLGDAEAAARAAAAVANQGKA